MNGAGPKGVLRGLGLMSGTSADGVDAARLELGADGHCRFRGWVDTPYPPDLRAAVLAANDALTVEAAARLDRRLGQFYGVVARDAMHGLGPVDFIAIHGQTIRHQPAGSEGFTLQIGSAADAVAATGLTVVNDFRRADVAAGGQGAPLVPPFHQHIFAAPGPRLILNLGGMANLTWLPGSHDPRPILAFDTGPGNVLLDAVADLHSGGRLHCDQGGRMALAGVANQALLAEWLDWPYFLSPPPKSTGREAFGLPLAAKLLGEWEGRVEDLMATLLALTAQSIARAVRRWTPESPEMLVFGGGAENPALLAALQRALPAIRIVHGAQATGIPSQALEALAFAWLGAQCLLGRPGNLPAVTGAARMVVLGGIHPGGNWPLLMKKMIRYKNK
ncbi:MAG: anhydro-N-acetylmuramic acid kinase [Acidithiobacillus sp.]|uniref:anhydro-N-acetylmuramic acid kinase n=1 Tax=Acidithiobacillus sp. TaxID=1872118 RepID=UPI003D08642A